MKLDQISFSYALSKNGSWTSFLHASFPFDCRNWSIFGSDFARFVYSLMLHHVSSNPKGIRGFCYLGGCWDKCQEFWITYSFTFSINCSFFDWFQYMWISSWQAAGNLSRNGFNRDVPLIAMFSLPLSLFLPLSPPRFKSSICFLHSLVLC